ncbi:uncharacterized protein VTP21DRAFT_769 [Calcarisporiella thermophila]|uniref:uncharacterized protein n=1 Tax=Calcarisporiella thermophila TaxID=911321 RepID=UPI0037436DC5
MTRPVSNEYNNASPIIETITESHDIMYQAISEDGQFAAVLWSNGDLNFGRLPQVTGGTAIDFQLDILLNGYERWGNNPYTLSLSKHGEFIAVLFPITCNLAPIVLNQKGVEQEFGFFKNMAAPEKILCKFFGYHFVVFYEDSGCYYIYKGKEGGSLNEYQLTLACKLTYGTLFLYDRFLIRNKPALPRHDFYVLLDPTSLSFWPGNKRRFSKYYYLYNNVLFTEINKGSELTLRVFSNSNPMVHFQMRLQGEWELACNPKYTVLINKIPTSGDLRECLLIDIERGRVLCRQFLPLSFHTRTKLIGSKLFQYNCNRRTFKLYNLLVPEYYSDSQEYVEELKKDIEPLYEPVDVLEFDQLSITSPNCALLLKWTRSSSSIRIWRETKAGPALPINTNGPCYVIWIDERHFLIVNHIYLQIWGVKESLKMHLCYFTRHNELYLFDGFHLRGTTVTLHYQQFVNERWEPFDVPLKLPEMLEAYMCASQMGCLDQLILELKGEWHPLPAGGISHVEDLFCNILEQVPMLLYERNPDGELYLNMMLDRRLGSIVLKAVSRCRHFPLKHPGGTSSILSATIQSDFGENIFKAAEASVQKANQTGVIYYMVPVVESLPTLCSKYSDVLDSVLNSIAIFCTSKDSPYFVPHPSEEAMPDLLDPDIISGKHFMSSRKNFYTYRTLSRLCTVQEAWAYYQKDRQYGVQDNPFAGLAFLEYMQYLPMRFKGVLYWASRRMASFLKYLRSDPQRSNAIVCMSPFPGICHYPRKDFSTFRAWFKEWIRPSNRSIFVQVILDNDVVISKNPNIMLPIINQKWRAYGWWAYALNVFFELLYFGVFAALIVDFSGISRSALGILSGFLSGIFILLEYRQFTCEGKRYLWQFHNYVNLATYCSVLATSLLYVLGIKNVPSWANSISMLILWVNLVMQLRVLHFFGIFIGIITQVFQRIASFLVVLLIILLAFSHAFYLLLKDIKNQPTISTISLTNDSSNRGILRGNITQVSDTASGENHFDFWFDALRSTYNFLLGQYETLDPFDDNMTVVILKVLFSFSTAIVLLNVLIALINGVYKVSEKEAEQTWMRNITRWLAQTELYTLTPGMRQNESLFPELIFFELHEEYRTAWKKQVERKRKEVATGDDLQRVEKHLVKLHHKLGLQDEKIDPDENPWAEEFGAPQTASVCSKNVLSSSPVPSSSTQIPGKRQADDPYLTGTNRMLVNIEERLARMEGLFDRLDKILQSPSGQT